MIRVVESDRMIVEKHCLRFLERYSVLSDVPAVLGLIPLETKIVHLYIVQNIEDTFNVLFGRAMSAVRDKHDRVVLCLC